MKSGIVQRAHKQQTFHEWLVERMPTLRVDVTTRGTLLDLGEMEEFQEKFGDRVKMTTGPFTIRESVDAEQVTRLIFEFSKEFAVQTLAAVFAMWLWKKLQNRPDASATVNGQPAQDPETIEKILRTIFERDPERESE